MLTMHIHLKSAHETRYDPEIALIIGAILYKYSMWDSGATYGAKLQDLKYIATRVSSHQSGLARMLIFIASRIGC
jgi:peroxin-2